jgi:F0F1-type ATP synthase assembly protein I
MMSGKLLITIVLILVALGIVMNYAPWLVNWFGKLPGDIRIEDEKKSLFIPITSSIAISIILSIIANLLFRK